MSIFIIQVICIFVVTDNTRHNHPSPPLPSPSLLGLRFILYNIISFQDHFELILFSIILIVFWSKIDERKMQTMKIVKIKFTISPYEILIHYTYRYIEYNIKKVTIKNNIHTGDSIKYDSSRDFTLSDHKR